MSSMRVYYERVLKIWHHYPQIFTFCPNDTLKDVVYLYA